MENGFKSPDDEDRTEAREEENFDDHPDSVPLFRSPLGAEDRIAIAFASWIVTTDVIGVRVFFVHASLAGRSVRGSKFFNLPFLQVTFPLQGD
jgi:hypothetical protein